MDFKAYLDRLLKEYDLLNEAVLTSSAPGKEQRFAATHNELVVLKDNCFLLISAIKDLHEHDGKIDETGQNELLSMVDEFFELSNESLKTK